TLDCLFLEGPAFAQPELDAYISGKGSWDAVDELTDRINPDLVDVAVELGMRVLAVDDDMPRTYMTYPENMHRRNIAMGTRIADSKCVSGMWIGGYWHIAPYALFDSIGEVLARNSRVLDRRMYANVAVEHVDEAFDRNIFEREAGATFDADVCKWDF